MAKDKEKKIARILYVEQGKTAKEISSLVSVSEVTISKWVTKLGWKDERNARLSSPIRKAENVRELINVLCERRLELDNELKEAEKAEDSKLIADIRAQIARADDSVSKWNKTYATINKENQIPLATYLSVMYMIFDSLKAFDESLYIKLLDFQEAHLQEASLKFK